MSECDLVAVYHNQVREILCELWPRCAVNIVNAGIGGDSTEGGLKRLETDVLSKNPDLVVISFGVNDSFSKGVPYAETYKENLKTMFERIKATGSEVIFMTPPMTCTAVGPKVTDPLLRRIAAESAEVQNGGTLTLYVEKAREAAKECGVPVAEAYAKWMKLYESGVNINAHIANGINHPSRNMHKLFAYAVLEAMFS
jgi:lysophospholipase L1-like esterase